MGSFSLHFRFNKRRYLFGLTNSLMDARGGLKKMQIDWVILPSQPYNVELSTFYWHLQTLSRVPWRSILVADLNTKRRLQVLVEAYQIDNTQIKWQLLKEHEITEEQILKVLSQSVDQIRRAVSPLRREPFGLGYNTEADEVNLIVAERGRTIILTHLCETYLIDPAQNILALLDYYGIPHGSLKAVLLTNSDNLNVFELLVKLKRVVIITEERVYMSLKNRIKQVFLWTQEMLKVRLRGKILCQQSSLHSHNSINFAYKASKQGLIAYWELMFGLKRVRLHCDELAYFPVELTQLKDLELLIVYEMAEGVKKDLQDIPEVYRKKVVYNRTERKYNNKYFWTLTQASPMISIRASESVRHRLNAMQGDHAYQFKAQDESAKLQKLCMKNSAVFNALERVIQVRKGYVRDESDKVYGVGAVLTGLQKVWSVGSSTIMYESASKIFFYENWKLASGRFMQGENLLKKVRQNSYVKTLQRYRQIVLSNQPKEIGDDEVQMGSPWQFFNDICRLRTYQEGQTVEKGKSIYIIVKGCLKFKNSELLANRNAVIGSIRQYFCSFYDSNEEIQVVKETWALQVTLEDLYNEFFKRFPEQMYELFTRGAIFD